MAVICIRVTGTASISMIMETEMGIRMDTSVGVSPIAGIREGEGEGYLP